VTYPETIYISLGSNIDPHEHLNSACDELFKLLEESRKSPVYHSPAVGMTGPDFLNAVVCGRTTQSVEKTVSALYDLERTHGRIRTSNKFSDRTLDLDLLLYGNQVHNSDSADTDETIVLPHPEILQQAYVLQPLADLAGDLIHPLCGVTINELRSRLEAQSPEKFSSLKMISE